MEMQNLILIRKNPFKKNQANMMKWMINYCKQNKSKKMMMTPLLSNRNQTLKLARITSTHQDLLERIDVILKHTICINQALESFNQMKVWACHMAQRNWMDSYGKITLVCSLLILKEIEICSSQIRHIWLTWQTKSHLIIIQ